MSPDSTGPELPGGALFSPLLEAAVRLAARGHYHQFRKNLTDEEGETPGGDFLPDRVPYIAHLMGAMCILARVGVRDEVLAAAILHDG
jgi:(p)ppGpp synthase/HD superfamily hydrolase